MLLKLSIEQERPTYLRLAQQLHLYPSEVHTSAKRARAPHLLQGSPDQERVNRTGLLELLLHGIRYVFPAEKGAMTRGVPTAFAASPLKEQIAPDSEPVPVWPFAEGTVRDYSFRPCTETPHWLLLKIGSSMSCWRSWTVCGTAGRVSVNLPTGN